MTIVIFLILLGILMSVLYRATRRGVGISVIIPFRCFDKENQRHKNFEWNREYWKVQLPGAEILQGCDPHDHLPFSKSYAINEAVARSSGDVLVLVDADGYVSAQAVLTCVKRIRRARQRGQRLWFIPYRQFYRLTEKASERVLHSDPCDPYQFPTPPKPCDVQNTSGSQHGHWFGAMIQIWPREAFDEVGGWDTRFRGWGGEDHAAMRACDTLYWPHKTLPGQVLHLWHPMLSIGGTSSWVNWDARMWENQTEIGANDRLMSRYYGANGDRKRMRKLVNENRKPKS